MLGLISELLSWFAGRLRSRAELGNLPSLASCRFFGDSSRVGLDCLRSTGPSFEKGTAVRSYSQRLKLPSSGLQGLGPVGCFLCSVKTYSELKQGRYGIAVNFLHNIFAIAKDSSPVEVIGAMTSNSRLARWGSGF